MKQYYFLLGLILIMPAFAQCKASQAEQEIAQKIAYLQKKFSHIHELVCVFESIAADISLIIQTKNSIKKEVIHTWLINCNLMRVSNDSKYSEPIETHKRSLFKRLFARLLAPQFAYLRTYIGLHNQLTLAACG